jgi:hypothetical protein
MKKAAVNRCHGQFFFFLEKLCTNFARSGLLLPPPSRRLESVAVSFHATSLIEFVEKYV